MEMTELNPCSERLESFAAILHQRRISVAAVFGDANIRALTGIVCDNGCLVVPGNGEVIFITDFRYVPMAHRVAPWLKTVELPRGKSFPSVIKAIVKKLGLNISSLGFEGSITASRYLDLQKTFAGVKLVDVEADILTLRAVKTADEIMRIAEAEALNDKIWALAQEKISYGMTEKDIQRIIRAFMNALGDGEAFETIVCAGANAAECHHVPDDTVWEHGQPLLVDMGVKLNGVCSDMTRNVKPLKSKPEYKKVYDTVLKANKAAIASAKPGMTAGELDKVARDVIAGAGYAGAFGHSLGHGVGYEIHELPTARSGDKMVLEPGMIVTIEPGIYLEGKLGVRIEDLVLITTTGCEVLSHSKK